MKDYLKDSSLYLIITFVIMAILSFSSSRTYERQSQVGLSDKFLGSHPSGEQLGNISFQYVGSEVNIQASGYSRFVELFIRKGAHFGTYFLLDDSWFIGLVSKIKGLFLTVVVSWLAAIGYAGSDKFHQTITDGRTSLFQDVMLDAMDALTTIVICSVVHGLKKNKERRR